METSIIASVTHPPVIVSARQSTLSGLSCGLGDPPGLSSGTDGARCQGSLSNGTRSPESVERLRCRAVPECRRGFDIVTRVGEDGRLRRAGRREDGRLRSADRTPARFAA
jgi:hypothetical protein